MMVRLRLEDKRRHRPARTRRRSTNAVLWAEVVCLLIGFACLGWVGYAFVHEKIYQSFEDYKLGENLHGQTGTIAGFWESLFGKKQEPPPPPPPVLNHEHPNIVDRGLVGKVEIPRLKISAMVREGVDTKTLALAVGHVPETARPGEPGNVAIAAHRDTFFRNVRYIKKGDDIRIVTPDGSFNYVVTSTSIVPPKNVKVLEPTPEKMLTLVTCYPFNWIGPAPNRFIVRARQVELSVSLPNGGPERSGL
jgi:sortase A